MASCVVGGSSTVVCVPPVSPNGGASRLTSRIITTNSHFRKHQISVNSDAPRDPDNPPATASFYGVRAGVARDCRLPSLRSSGNLPCFTCAHGCIASRNSALSPLPWTSTNSGFTPDCNPITAASLFMSSMICFSSFWFPRLRIEIQNALTLRILATPPELSASVRPSLGASQHHGTSAYRAHRM